MEQSNLFETLKDDDIYNDLLDLLETATKKLEEQQKYILQLEAQIKEYRTKAEKQAKEIIHLQNTIEILNS